MKLTMKGAIEAATSSNTEESFLHGLSEETTQIDLHQSNEEVKSVEASKDQPRRKVMKCRPRNGANKKVQQPNVEKENKYDKVGHAKQMQDQELELLLKQL